MIFIARDQKDEHGKDIKPNQTWFDTADNLKQKAINDGPNHKVTDHYKTDRVRAALEKLFHGKCAYCEEKLKIPWDVEHFRPKGRVKESPNHPGYYWLAYTWDNLYPSCPSCNRRLKDKPSWDDTSGSTAGKLDQFPLSNEAHRQFSPSGSLKNEDPLLLDPCDAVEKPENHLTYNALGNPIAKKQSIYGAETIKICHLSRKRHKNLVKRTLGKLKQLLQLHDSIQDPHQKQALHQYIKDSFLKDHCECAGAARAANDDRAIIGL